MDVGTIIKLFKNMVVNVAAWYNYLQQEFVYSGDGGFVEFSGKTRRLGIDFSGRYQPIKHLYLDVDVNYAHARVIDEQKGEDFVPLAPTLTSSGGITYQHLKGWSASLRYRYLADRPGNEDNSIVAEGYMITDATLGLVKPTFEVMLFVNNVLNTRWKETQFTTLTRLKNEAQPVEEICFTPGYSICSTGSSFLFFW